MHSNIFIWLQSFEIIVRSRLLCMVFFQFKFIICCVLFMHKHNAFDARLKGFLLSLCNLHWLMKKRSLCVGKSMAVFAVWFASRSDFIYILIEAPLREKNGGKCHCRPADATLPIYFVAVPVITDARNGLTMASRRPASV